MRPARLRSRWQLTPESLADHLRQHLQGHGPLHRTQLRHGLLRSGTKPAHPRALVCQEPPSHQAGQILQGVAVIAGAKGAVGIAQAACLFGGQQPVSLQAIEEADIVAEFQQIRVLVGPSQNRILNHKFDIGDTARTLLEVELVGPAAPQFCTHTLAHLADLQHHCHGRLPLFAFLCGQCAGKRARVEGVTAGW